MVLFCLPYAGGGAGVFRQWQTSFPPTVDVQPVQLPGRENRIAEPARVDPDEIADAIIRRADRRYAIDGHSMGARLGFEWSGRRAAAVPGCPERLYVGGCCPPDLTESIVRLARLDNEAFVQGLVELGGTPSGMLDLPEVRELVLPPLRADFAWLDGYRYLDEPPLGVPIVGFAGAADRSVDPAQMAGWAAHTTPGSVCIRCPATTSSCRATGPW